jgi:ABC-type transport system involved in cytochrome c biogenesis permease component
VSILYFPILYFPILSLATSSRQNIIKKKLYDDRALAITLAVPAISTIFLFSTVGADTTPLDYRV